jgi:hypothetical protein
MCEPCAQERRVNIGRFSCGEATRGAHKNHRDVGVRPSGKNIVNEQTHNHHMWGTVSSGETKSLREKKVAMAEIYMTTSEDGTGNA